MQAPGTPAPDVLFREVQLLRPWWIWVIVTPPIVLQWIGVYIQIVLGTPFGNNPAPDWLLILLWLLTGIGLPVFLWSVRLITEVRSDGVYVRYVPFHVRERFVPAASITSARVVSYEAIREFAGWGIRDSIRRRAYTMSGDEGVELTVPDGKPLLIGTRRPDEMMEAIGRLIPVHPPASSR